MTTLRLRSPSRMLQDPMNLWEEMWSDFPRFTMHRRREENTGDRVSPRVDIYETNDNFVVECELPGMKKDDIHVNVEDNRLSIHGERRREEETEERSYYYSERSYESFDRSFRLPAGMDPEKVDAGYRDGVLRITLPKTEEAKAKQIKVT